MESQHGCHDGAERGLSEVKPGQMDMIAAMLAGMRQELAMDREAQAQRAREQAQRADDQVRHLEDVLQSSVPSLKVETQQYTDQACDSVRNELLDKVQTLEGDVQCLREEVRTEKQRRELATVLAEEQEAPHVLAGTTRVADLLGLTWGPWQELSARGPRSVMSEPVAVSGGWGTIGTPPLSPAGGRLGLSQVGLSEKTLVRPDMLAATLVPDAPQRLCSVMGHCVQLKGPVDVHIGMGTAVERLPVYVTDLDEPCLLRLDYLTQSKACSRPLLLGPFRGRRGRELPATATRTWRGLPKTGMSLEQTVRRVTVVTLTLNLGLETPSLSGAADSPQPTTSAAEA
ncbi:hypothetical protein O3P69_001756 [Scylla paramamosain]|uniref:Uncharacterized protein n=1 Tax=Scylla paramamosain TaxID=85552 RepID=A0AAW0V3I0_SCYPA